MAYQTINSLPTLSQILLIDNVAWTILCAVSTDNLGSPTVYILPTIEYTDFKEVLVFLKAQTLTKSISISGANALSFLPLIAELYNSSAVPSGATFTLKASVQGFNGNANVNTITVSGQSLATFNLSTLTNPSGLTLIFSL